MPLLPPEVQFLGRDIRPGTILSTWPSIFGIHKEMFRCHTPSLACTHRRSPPPCQVLARQTRINKKFLTYDKVKCAKRRFDYLNTLNANVFNNQNTFNMFVVKTR